MAESNPLQPKYLLAWALDHHPGGDGTPICAHLVAPTLIRRSMVGSDANHVLSYADIIADYTGHRLIFFSQLSAALSDNNQTWEGLDVDWEHALRDLAKPGIPGYDFGLYYRDWIIARGGARQMILVANDGSRDSIDVRAEQDVLRGKLTPMAYKDWPDFIGPSLRAGQGR